MVNKSLRHLSAFLCILIRFQYGLHILGAETLLVNTLYAVTLLIIGVSTLYYSLSAPDYPLLEPLAAVCVLVSVFVFNSLSAVLFPSCDALYSLCTVLPPENPLSPGWKLESVALDISIAILPAVPCLDRLL